MKNGIEKNSWGAFRQIGIIGGIAFLLFMIYRVMLLIQNGTFELSYPDSLEWPQYVLIALTIVFMLPGLLGTFAKVPVWLWIERIKDWWKSRNGKENQS